MLAKPDKSGGRQKFPGIFAAIAVLYQKKREGKAMKLWQEFKDFAFKGNVVDMAVGVVIGGASARS